MSYKSFTKLKYSGQLTVSGEERRQCRVNENLKLKSPYRPYTSEMSLIPQRKAFAVVAILLTHFMPLASFCTL